MLRRPRLVALAAAALVVVAAVVVASLLVSRGPDAPRFPPVADPLGAALAHADPAAPVVAVLPTATSGPAKTGLDALTATLPAADLAKNQVEGMLRDALGLDWRTVLRRAAGEPLVAWADALDPRRAAAALVTRRPEAVAEELADRRDAGRVAAAGTYREFDLSRLPGGRVLARRGQELVLAPDGAAVRAAIDRAAGRAGLDRAQLATRGLGLGDGAGVLVLVDAKAVAARLLGADAVARVPWLAALGRGAVELRASAGGLDVRGRAQLAASLPTADLPLARGSAPPAARGAGLGPVIVGVRDPGQLVRTLRAALPALGSRGAGAGAARGVDAAATQLDRLLGLDLDGELVDRLRGTLSLVAGRALDVVVARAELSDPDGVGSALSRAGTLSKLGGLADLAGVDTGGYGIDGSDDRIRISRDGTALGVAALRGDALVLSNDARADVDAAAKGRPLAVPAGARGALLAVADAPGLAAAVIPRLGLPSLALGFLGPVGDPWLSAEVEDAGVEVRARVPLTG